MTVLTWPELEVSAFRWKLNEKEVAFASMFGSQAQQVGVPTWSVELSGVPKYWAEADQIATFLESFRGYKNQLELHHLTNSTPKGSMRGFPVLHDGTSAGGLVLNVFAGLDQVGATIRRSDLLGIGSTVTQQVVRVVSDAVVDGDGMIEIHLGIPLRSDFNAGQSLRWNKPKVLFRQSAANDGIEYVPVVGQPWSLSLIEDWRP